MMFDAEVERANIVQMLIENVEAEKKGDIEGSMIFYDEDNITIIATFDLKDASGNPADESKNVFERVKV